MAISSASTMAARAASSAGLIDRFVAAGGAGTGAAGRSDGAALDRSSTTVGFVARRAVDNAAGAGSAGASVGVWLTADGCGTAATGAGPGLKLGVGSAMGVGRAG
jgi:hypothetical protein